MKSSLLVGPLVIFAGLLFLVGNLRLLAVEQVWRFWPLLLIAVGLNLIIRRRCGCGCWCLCEGGDA